MRAFIGLVDYYSEMWDRRSYLLKHLSASTSDKVKFKWRAVEQKEFEYIKRIVMHGTLLAYPYFNGLFDIHINYSDYHMG